jgi:predicted component of type VI protein secretion system
MIPGARLRPPLRLLRVEVDDVAHDTGWVDAKMFLARHPHNEDADLTIRPESGSE